jgi:hypothetical protein
MNSKPWYRSKTFLVNGLVILGGLATQAAAALPPDSKTAVWAGVALAAINAGLRVTTNQAITL